MKKLTVTILLLFALGSCKEEVRKEDDVPLTENGNFDLDRIKRERKLVALIDYSSTSYFIYRGTAMGFEYDLLHKFADHLNIDLIIRPIINLDSISILLNNNQVDLVAANLTVTKERQRDMSFTEPITYTSQVLVQRKPENWRSIPRHKTEEQLIKDPIELAYKKVYIRKNSSFHDRLLNISDEIGEPIYIEEVPGEVTTEHLIEQVANGEIDYTISDEHVAAVNSVNYDILDISTPVSFKQKIAWAVRKSSPKLLEEINTWLASFRKTTEFAVIYNKYFKNKSSYKTRLKSDYFSTKSGIISPYDKSIKKYSEIIGWDWKLLASVVYQESNFNPSAVSWTGAFGLMQIMPQTAFQYGVDSNSSPQENLRAGVEYLKWIDEAWSKTIEDKKERIKFVLASYNVGLGHIMDARNLAEKYDKDPKVWDENVAEFVLKKSESKYYRDPVVKHGYCRGSEPYQYVKEILKRYNQYQNLVES